MKMYLISKKILRTGCMRMKRKKVWILSGVPGSGKTTWVKEQIAKRGGVHCSRDEVRFAMLKDGEDYFAHENALQEIAGLVETQSARYGGAGVGAMGKVEAVDVETDVNLLG